MKHLVAIPRDIAQSRGMKKYCTMNICKHGHFSERKIDSGKAWNVLFNGQEIGEMVQVLRNLSQKNCRALNILTSAFILRVTSYSGKNAQAATSNLHNIVKHLIVLTHTKRQGICIKIINTLK